MEHPIGGKLLKINVEGETRHPGGALAGTVYRKMIARPEFYKTSPCLVNNFLMLRRNNNVRVAETEETLLIILQKICIGTAAAGYV
jgi:hypothetical protein